MARREEALIFLIPGVVSPSLPSGFSFPAAYGDLFAAILAVLAIWSLSARVWFAISMGWVFNVWGAVDLLVAFYQGLLGVNIDPGWLSAAYFIPTVVVPPLLVTHGLMFCYCCESHQAHGTRLTRRRNWRRPSPYLTRMRRRPG
jgi:hypothetical protein